MFKRFANNNKINPKLISNDDLIYHLEKAKPAESDPLNRSGLKEKLSYTPVHPLYESQVVVVLGLIHQKVSPKCVNEGRSTEHRSYNRLVNRSPNL